VAGDQLSDIKGDTDEPGMPKAGEGIGATAATEEPIAVTGLVKY
jgi:hypothetical protein